MNAQLKYPKGDCEKTHSPTPPAPSVGKLGNVRKLESSDHSPAHLVAKYHKIQGVTPLKKDAAYIGQLCDMYGTGAVDEALDKLAVSMITNPVKKPLSYLKGIIVHQAEEQRSKSPPKATDRNRADPVLNGYFYNFEKDLEDWSHADQGH